MTRTAWVVRERSDGRVRGRGSHGIEVPTRPLIDIVERRCLTHRELGERLSMTFDASPESCSRMWCRLKTRQWVNLECVERFAIALGLHPGEVWGWDVYGLHCNGDDQHAWDFEPDPECIVCGVHAEWRS